MPVPPYENSKTSISKRANYKGHEKINPIFYAHHCDRGNVPGTIDHALAA